MFRAVFLAVTCLAGVARLSAADRLNVVLMLADDLGWGELGCYGQKKIPTPNIDRLAALGMRMMRHYSGAPVCAPSRCVLMTGRHLGHAEIRGNRQASVSFPEFTEGQHPVSGTVPTLAQAFQKAGYTTAAMGKWGLGPVGSTGAPNRQGIDQFFGYNCQAVAHSYYPPHLWRNAEKFVLNAVPIPGHRKRPAGDVTLEEWIGETYAPDVMVDEAVRFIDTHQNKPFFLYLPFIEPHVALHPPKAAVEQFPAEWDDEPYRGENGYLPHPRPRAAYAALISQLDAHVGRVLDALDVRGLTGRTLVLFTSDNGPTHPGQPGTRFHIGGADPEFFESTRGLRGYKGSVYEGGLRVPLIARLPGKISAGQQSDALGSFADLFPTLADAAGLEVPEGLDGESLWPALTGQPQSARKKPLIWVFPEYGGQVAVHFGNEKVVRQRLNAPQPGPWEVYDLVRDPNESNSSQNPETIARAVDVLRQEVSENPIFPMSLPGVTERPR